MTKVAIVAANFNQAIVNPMIEAAKGALAEKNADLKQIITVPGCYEIPLVVETIADAVDAIVVLGYIEKGETLHGEVMGHVVHAELVKAQRRHNKPIGLGIIGPGATVEQAEVRKEKSARAAVTSVFAVLNILRR